MVEKICVKGEFWAWNETVNNSEYVMDGEQVGGENVWKSEGVSVTSPM